MPLPASLTAAAALLLVACAPAAAAPLCPGAVDPSFVVFVGAKISVEEVAQRGPEIPFDSAFLAKYRVVQVVCGPAPTENIEFLAYDHYGQPAFSEFKTALLYISRVDGKWVHEKYQYQPVFKAISGEWVGCGNPYEWEHESVPRVVQALPRSFKKAPTFEIGKKSFASRDGAYPQPYFENLGKRRARCVAGSNLEELFTVKQMGVLKAREVFK